MSYGKYLSECGRIYKQQSSWRKGQTYFNVLVQVRPDLSERIRTSHLDPFYLDERIPEFLEWICTNW